MTGIKEALENHLMGKHRFNINSRKEWFERLWPTLLAWLVGVVLAFFPLGIKQLTYKMLGAPVESIFLDIEVLYICVTASAVVVCYIMQEKFKKGSKLSILMNAVIIFFGAVVYAISKSVELISQKWPAIEISKIEQIWPGFILTFFICTSALNILTYVLLLEMNLPVKSSAKEDIYRIANVLPEIDSLVKSRGGRKA